ncbi:MAG: sulfur carrier protein ThiS [Caulobacter sp.]|nr:sulfur carrier protein ThiS [Caulobacter sp.]
MQIHLNGERQSLNNIATVAELVAHLDLDRRKVAVERNLEIVPRSLFEATPIENGDRIEIVTFIGGG